MGSQWRAGVRRQTAESDTVLLTDDSLLSRTDDIADQSLWSSRVAADGDTAATNANDAVEWLDRVLRCALYGQGGPRS
jgi:hypothetical protein